MARKDWTPVEHYFTNLLIEPDAGLDAALETGAAAGLPPLSVSPNQGKLLHLLARSIGARSILEIGTFIGYSAIWLARALPANGRLISLEVDARNTEIANVNIARAGLASVVDVRLGLALETLPQLAAEDQEPFDFVFIDGDKPNNAAYFEWAVRLARPGALIVVDNVVRGGNVIDGASADPVIQGVRRLTEQLAANPRVSATAVQTVGSKGYDGFAIALVEGDRGTG